MDIQALTVDEIWQEIDRLTEENPDAIGNLEGSFAFHIKSDEEKSYTIILKNRKAEISASLDEHAGCILTMNEKNFKKLIDGTLNAPAAFMTGKLKVKGNMGLALKLESALKKFTK